MNVVISISTEQMQALVKMLDDVKYFGNNLANPMSKSAFYMLDSVTKNFEQEGRPTKWQEWSRTKHERSMSYSQWREYIRKPKGILTLAVTHGQFVRSGELKKSIQVAPPNKEGVLLRAGSQAPYAAQHQFGSSDGKTPARPFLMFQEQDVLKITGFFEDGLKKALKA